MLREYYHSNIKEQQKQNNIFVQDFNIDLLHKKAIRVQ